MEAVRGLLEAVRQDEYDSKARFVERWARGQHVERWARTRSTCQLP